MGGDYNSKSLDAVVARIEEKLDSFISHHSGLERRVEALEAFKWKLVGAIIAIETLVGLAWYSVANV